MLLKNNMMISRNLGSDGAFVRSDGDTTTYILGNIQLKINDVDKIQNNYIPHLSSYNGSFEISLKQKNDATFWNIIVYTESDIEMLNILVPAENVYEVQFGDTVLSC